MLNEDHSLLPHTEMFFGKYEDRGYEVVDEEVFRAFEGHECWGSRCMSLDAAVHDG